MKLGGKAKPCLPQKILWTLRVTSECRPCPFFGHYSYSLYNDDNDDDEMSVARSPIDMLLRLSDAFRIQMVAYSQSR